MLPEFGLREHGRQILREASQRFADVPGLGEAWTQFGLIGLRRGGGIGRRGRNVCSGIAGIQRGGQRTVVPQRRTGSKAPVVFLFSEGKRRVQHYQLQRHTLVVRRGGGPCRGFC